MTSLGRRRARLVFLAAAAVLGLLALRVALWTPLALQGSAPADGFTRVRGIVHVHTTLSDGGGPPEEVAAAARAAGLRFVVITDHNNVDAKAFEGEHDGVLVLVGTEISTTAGHVLGLGVRDPVFRFSGDALDALADVRDLGGVAVAAHPLSPRDDLRWTGWDLPGAWGFELVNGDSQWRDAPWWRLLRVAGLYPLNPRYALLGLATPPDAVLARWDAMLAQRDVAGTCGADAHGRVEVGKKRSVRFPPYRSMFEVTQEHVVLDRPLGGDAAADGAAIVSALGRGHSYVGLDALADANDFSFVAEGAGRPVTMGDTVAPGPGLKLRAGGRMPAGARVTIRRDGAAAAEGEGAAEVAASTPGVYRTEVRVPGWSVPWILSNPIYVFGPEAAAERARHAAWPAAELPPPATEMLDSFEGTTRFEAGSDENSKVEPPILEPRAGGDGRSALRLRFRLGMPDAAHPSPFCALVDWTHRDLAGRRGLVFSIRGDGVYRIWVQVRDANPASTDEGTEWWFASVKTSGDWQKVAIPFERLRSINPHSDGRLDLDKVRAIVFVLDRGADKPGSRGSIWLDDLGVY